MVEKVTDIGQEKLLKDITSLLQRSHIQYMITGSLSVIFYGRPRASHDIDFIVEAKKKDIPRIKNAFLTLPQNEFIVDASMIEDAIIHKFQFNILHLPTMLKLDFWLLTESEFDKTRFKRRKTIHVFSQKMTFASAEDTILIKLLWYNDSKIEKHLIDAAFVYQIQEKKLDKKYLQTWAKKQNLENLLHQLASIDLEEHY